MLLGTASEGDYVTFAREGFEQAKSMLDDYLDNARLQNILIEAQNVLDSAEKNAEADYKKAVAEADRTGAAAAASAVDTSFTFSSAASSAVSAAYTEKLEVDKDVPDDHDSEQLKGN
ncbi:hypothetical protein N0V94_006857 [Neodidymelliopsis sp. IMI 364377]|nr:hypothetical protein N0V94_006857 [Neodidymelliopsis sp. IMI 364377]